ncbi:hypothetical protein RHGRI_020464 [Rhododendron griersonianum]|uniref:Uncharacterized protein n=1 Tax=Rhododendron griersonianum TaxID=479676 RepID=A0AAV6JJB5_9ERIC|nr:hypothetical protein RHGRI_020464 [Rhododendron griersonianum]
MGIGKKKIEMKMRDARVCSRKPTSSIASPGPTLPLLFSFRPAALTFPSVLGFPLIVHPEKTVALVNLDQNFSIQSTVRQNLFKVRSTRPIGFPENLAVLYSDNEFRVSRKSNRFAWVRNFGGLEMVRPFENWERLVRATPWMEKLRHDGRGSHERAPSGIAGSVLLSLTWETNMDLILPAADKI